MSQYRKIIDDSGTRGATIPNSLSHIASNLDIWVIIPLQSEAESHFEYNCRGKSDET